MPWYRNEQPARFLVHFHENACQIFLVMNSAVMKTRVIFVVIYKHSPYWTCFPPYRQKILHKLKKTFPGLREVATYAGPKSTLSKSREELRLLYVAGLTRAYLGVESGDEQVLKETCKGVTSFARGLCEANST